MSLRAVRSSSLPLIMCVGGFVAVCSALIYRGSPEYWAHHDAIAFHLQQIQWFREHGITLTYEATSATTPGFHWLVAVLADAVHVGRPLSIDDWLVRVVPLCLTAGALVLIYLAIRNVGADDTRAAVLLFPIMSSSYVLAGAVYPVTESLALLGYASMAYALAGPARGTVPFVVGSVIAVSARQTFWPATLAWPAASVVKAWIGEGRWTGVLPAALATLPATAVLITFVSVWGGLTPPEFAGHRAEGLVNVTPIVHALALIGLFSIPYYRPSDFENIRHVLVDGALSGLLAAVLWYGVRLTPSHDEGRFSSVVWTISGYSPLVFERPVLVLALLFLGLFMMAVALRRAQTSRSVTGELLLLGAVIVSQGGQALSWQRYVEPQILIFLSVNLARSKARSWIFDGVLVVFFSVWLLLSVMRISGVIGGAGAGS